MQTTINDPMILTKFISACIPSQLEAKINEFITTEVHTLIDIKPMGQNPYSVLIIFNPKF